MPASPVVKGCGDFGVVPGLLPSWLSWRRSCCLGVAEKDRFGLDGPSCIGRITLDCLDALGDGGYSRPCCVEGCVGASSKGDLSQHLFLLDKVKFSEIQYCEWCRLLPRQCTVTASTSRVELIVIDAKVTTILEDRWIPPIV